MCKGKPGLLCYHDKKRFKTVDNGVPGPGAYTVREVLVHVHHYNIHVNLEDQEGDIKGSNFSIIICCALELTETVWK